MIDIDSLCCSFKVWYFLTLTLPPDSGRGSYLIWNVRLLRVAACSGRKSRFRVFVYGIVFYGLGIFLPSVFPHLTLLKVTGLHL